MTQLIIGTPDSGKSQLAESIVSSMGNDHGLYYIATMIPYGEDGVRRVEKHRRMREGKGFITLEVPYDVNQAAIPDRENSIVLLEGVSNLAANELFESKTPYNECIEKIVSDITLLAMSVREMVIVSNHFEITEEFSAETALYSRLMDEINYRLEKVSDRVIRL